MSNTYTVTHNSSGETWTSAFTASDFHAFIIAAADAAANGHAPTHEQMARQIDIWNRAQVAHRQEFSYRLN